MFINVIGRKWHNRTNMEDTELMTKKTHTPSSLVTRMLLQPLSVWHPVGALVGALRFQRDVTSR